jgi:hypothetical protein
MRRVLFLTTAFLFVFSIHALAQDSNYWDNQYGTKSELLGGLVVGSPTDLSATFYNPGWIALRTDTSFLLTTVAAEAYQIKLKEGLGVGTEPTSSSVNTSPGFLAGRFTVGEDRTWQWAYSYLQKVKFKFDAVGVRVDAGGEPPTNGRAWFAGESFRVSQSNEYWYGLTFSRKLADDVGLGFTPYVVQRTMKSRSQTSVQDLALSGDFRQAYFAEEYDFWHFRLLAKIGLAVEKGNLTYGLTLTTPGLGLFGSGEVLTNKTFSGRADDAGGIESPKLSADYQKDLSAS